MQKTAEIISAGIVRCFCVTLAIYPKDKKPVIKAAGF